MSTTFFMASVLVLSSPFSSASLTSFWEAALSKCTSMVQLLSTVPAMSLSCSFFSFDFVDVRWSPGLHLSCPILDVHSHRDPPASFVLSPLVSSPFERGMGRGSRRGRSMDGPFDPFHPVPPWMGGGRTHAKTEWTTPPPKEKDRGGSRRGRDRGGRTTFLYPPHAPFHLGFEPKTHPGSKDPRPRPLIRGRVGGQEGSSPATREVSPSRCSRRGSGGPGLRVVKWERVRCRS